MAQATFSVRMDKDLKDRFDDLCQDFGMNMSTAINIFARAVVRERKIPFDICAPNIDITREGALQAFQTLRKEAAKNGVSGLSLDDINREIISTRQDTGA